MADVRVGAVVAVMLLLNEEEEELKKKRNRVTWTRPWIARREGKGIFHQLVQELALEDEASYRDFFRLDKRQFQYVAEVIGPRIRKEDTKLRLSIKPEERLAVTLRFLATGETFQSLEYSFRISRTSISNIVIESCEAIIELLGPRYLKTPRCEEEWAKVASLFESRWNFPNGIGAIDGKRVLIQQPSNSGSHYFDYKSHNSIILLAVFGPNYEVLWADVGTNGRAPDGAIWQRSDFKRLLSSEENELNLPRPKPLPGREKQIPHVLTGDDAFGLTSYLMKPYPRSQLTNEQRIFNYRLSRMRRISENGFGILANRWRFFRSPLLLSPDKVSTIVFAVLVLHNFLRPSFPSTLIDREDPTTGQITPGDWRGEHGSPAWIDFHPICSNNFSNESRLIREEFMCYFSNEGAVPWQWRHCGID